MVEQAETEEQVESPELLDSGVLCIEGPELDPGKSSSGLLHVFRAPIHAHNSQAVFLKKRRKITHTATNVHSSFDVGLGSRRREKVSDQVLSDLRKMLCPRAIEKPRFPQY
jgi:hypothetical protein